MTRILMVDDAANNLLTLSALLEDEGFHVDTAASLAEARPLLAAGAAAYALALVDLRLGDGSGTALVPMLRSSSPGTKIVLMSGDKLSGELAKLVDGGFVKGAPVAQLLALVHALVSDPSR